MRLIVFFLLLTHLISAVPDKVVIIRHAEKISKSNQCPYLSGQGLTHSLLLPLYFKNNFAVPVALFAQGQTSESDSLRPIQTLAPTASFYATLFPEQADKFTIITDFLSDQVEALAHRILSTDAYNNQTVFVCWSHDNLQKLAGYLGVKNPPEWKGKDYDKVWLITFNQKTKKVHSFSIKEQVLTESVDKALSLWNAPQ